MYTTYSTRRPRARVLCVNSRSTMWQRSRERYVTLPLDGHVAMAPPAPDKPLALRCAAMKCPPGSSY